jgi:hypothetical protein
MLLTCGAVYVQNDPTVLNSFSQILADSLGKNHDSQGTAKEMCYVTRAESKATG